ncbi:cytochrome C oxidase subunit IV family protein [Sphingomonas sp. ID0503]|uniref:cytochrome C oxidase subunit IV family protein n=1 Tax=Sphingomonas sp. ID0503 TaxID=3399691 RepID=UPI003AFB0ABF
MTRSSVAGIALVVLTLGSFAMGETHSATLFAGLAIVVAAMVKVNLVISEFMHLRWPHRPFRQFTLLWTGVIAAILFTGLTVLPW